MSSGRAATAALAAGLVLALAFPKPGLHPLVWVSLVPLILVVRGRDPWRAWLLGMAFGLALRGATLYWVTHAMTRFGGLSWPVAALAAVALAAYLALYQGAFAVVAAGADLRGVRGMVLLAATWTGLEWIQGVLFSGFPWALLGYAGGGWSPLLQVADVAGVWGLSFLVVLLNGAIAAGVVHGRRAMQPIVVATLALLLSAGYGAWRLADAPPLASATDALAVEVTGDPGSARGPGAGRDREARRGVDAGGAPDADRPADALRAAVVQGNVSQDRKWDPASRQELVERHLDLSRRALEMGAQLVVWAESSWPDPLGVERDPGARRRIGALASEHGAALLMGSVHVDDAGDVANSAVLFGPDGGVAGRYDKVHLVPFGEYLPLREWLPESLDPLVQAVGALRPGDASQPLLGSRRSAIPTLGLAICYEIVFPRIVRERVTRGAELLVTITNDAWYGITSGPYQHYVMARFRAVENRRWLLRAANTGISAIVDPWGREAGRTGLETRAVLVGDVAPGTRDAPYRIVGDALGQVSAAVAVLALAATLFGRGGRRGRASGPS